MRLGIILAFALVLASAQEPASIPERHDSIVVTGSAQPTPLEEADRNVASITLPLKQRSLFDSWFNLLQLDPSLDLQQRAPGGFLADLSIRGATFGQTLVLLNGMRINDAQTGHFNLDLPVPLDFVSAIETLKGSGSTLYGSDAIGGVVNIRTAPVETPDLRLLTSLGNFGRNEEHLRTAFGVARLSESLAIERDFSTGFAPDRDYRNLALSSLTSARSALGATSVLLTYSDRPYGANQFYGNYPSWERIKTWFASIHQDIGERTEASFAYRRHTDLFVLYRDAPQIYTNRHILDSYQGDLRRHDPLPFNAILSYGAEGLADSIHSTNLGVRSRKRGSAYMFYDIRTARRFSFSAGIREEVYGSGQVATSPTLSGAVWLASRVKFRASASRAFRLPTYTDLYYSDPANRGNPNLRPESATSYEAGADVYLRNRLHAAVTAFQRRDSNVIDYVRSSAAEPWQATNFDKLHFTGVEAAVVYEPAAGQRLSVSLTALHGAKASEEVLLSKYAFNYPTQRAAAEWRGTVARRILARTSVGVVNRIARNPYAIWDASAGYANGRIRPFLQLSNITSTEYQEIPNIVMPKRGIIGGVEFVFYGADR